MSFKFLLNKGVISLGAVILLAGLVRAVLPESLIIKDNSLFDFTRSIALGDVDGDGDLDVVAGNLYATTAQVYLNNGTIEPFRDVQGATISADYTTSIALGDMDGDGDLDVVAGSESVNTVYLSNGTAQPFRSLSGVSRPPVPMHANPDIKYTNSINVGDVDGDGDLDVVTGNLIGNKVYMNNGTDRPFEDGPGPIILGPIIPVVIGDLDVVTGN